MQLGKSCLLGIEPKPEQLPTEPSQGLGQAGTPPLPPELTVQRTHIVTPCHMWVQPSQGAAGIAAHVPTFEGQVCRRPGEGLGRFTVGREVSSSPADHSPPRE